MGELPAWRCRLRPGSRPPRRFPEATDGRSFLDGHRLAPCSGCSSVRPGPAATGGTESRGRVMALPRMFNAFLTRFADMGDVLSRGRGATRGSWIAAVLGLAGLLLWTAPSTAVGQAPGGKSAAGKA